MRKKFKQRFDRIKLNTKFTGLTILITVIPIAFLAGVLFYNMEKNVVDEHMRYMEYKTNQSENHVSTGMDSLSMSTQFFLADEQMKQILIRAKNEQELTTQELLEFQQNDIKNLERLVNNNPLLYSVRIYAENNNVQEMMPILYNNARMYHLEWAKEQCITGWHFGYYDTSYSSLIVNQEDALVGLVTGIEDFQNGTLGVIEATMKMETMFPGLYEEHAGEWSFLIDAKGNLLYGSNRPEDADSIAPNIVEYVENHTDDTNTLYRKVGKNKYVISYLEVPNMGVTLVETQDITEAVQSVYRSRTVFILVMILVLIGLSFLINRIIMQMLRQFYTILDTIYEVQDGNLSARISVQSYDEMGELAEQLNTMLERIQKLMEENIAREVLAKNSQIRALQNQINAHFIYNVLETIKMMAEIDGKFEISDAITSLGKLLRYSMKWASGNVKLEDELEYIRNYVALMNLRYDFKVFLSLQLPDILMDQEIPKMSLQPIVENAILHGIEPLSEDTTIYIKGWMEEEVCIVEITDAGCGMTEEQLEKLRTKLAGKVDANGGKGNGIGLKNVQDRIQMAFGAKYGLTIASKEGCYTKVAIRLPRNTMRDRVI